MSDRQMPSLAAVAAYWKGNREGHFPNWRPDWPSCAACGWDTPLGPVSWAKATAWLDRAHLHDRCYGGPDEPANIVPLCHLCHSDMPSFEGRDAALAWVDGVRAASWAWNAFTYHRFEGRTSAVSRHATLAHARRDFLEAAVKHPGHFGELV